MEFKCYSGGNLQFVEPRVSEPVSFAHVTDLHLSPDPPELWPDEFRHGIGWWDAAFEHPNRRLPGLLDDIRGWDVDFILFGGDVLDTYHPEPADRVLRLCRERGLVGLFQFGNHDWEPPHIRYQPQEHEEDVREDYLLKLCRHWEMPATYYAFQHSGVRFVVLDSVYVKRDGQYAGYFQDDQVTWFLDQLQYDGPIVIFHHVPFHVPTLTHRIHAASGSIGGLAEDENGRRMREAIANCPNILGTFTGHYHLQSEDPLDNTWQFMTGPAINGSWRYVRITAVELPASLHVDGSPWRQK